MTEKIKKNGITLIALIITIVIMLILVSVSMAFVSGDKGIVATAIESKFRAEMSKIREQHDLNEYDKSIVNEYREFITPGTEILELGTIDEEEVTIEDIQEFSNTLKMEIVLARNMYRTVNGITNTKKMWNYNVFDIQTHLKDQGYLETLVEGIYYINTAEPDSNKKNIYDQKTDICYKIADTKIGKATVHSVEYLNFYKYGTMPESVIKVNMTPEITESTGGIRCYEPNLDNFKYATEIIYYSADLKTVKTVSIEEYMENERQRTITENDATYTFYDYSSGKRIWANIKTSNNSLEAYWVWIPRYAYKIENNVITVEYVDLESNALNLKDEGGNLLTKEQLEEQDYTLHEAFSQGDGLTGIWFSKYNVSKKETMGKSSLAESPNMSKFNSNTTKLIYYNPNDLTDQKEVEFSVNPTQTKEIDGTTYYFYDYQKKIWANVKCLNTNSEATEADDLESYWVWIPRYAYKIESGKVDVILVDINDKPIDENAYGDELPEEYVVHEAFSQGDGLTGIWFSKYNVSSKETVPNSYQAEPPNMSKFNNSTTKLIYYNPDDLTDTKEENFSLNPSQTKEIDGTTYYFYDYQKKIWANVKCLNTNSETTEADDLESYWVWIPRYAYKIESGQIAVILVDTNDKPIDRETYGDSLPANYVVHEAFSQGDGLTGIWFSKYNVSQKEIDI